MAVADRLTEVPFTVAFAVGAVTEMLVVALLTVKLTAAEVVVVPPESTAVTVTVWLAFVSFVLSKVVVYGALVSAVPAFTPSILNCTLVMVSPVPAVTEAVRVAVVPLTVALAAGTVTDSVVLLTVMLTGDEVTVALLESVTMAVTMCVPFVSFVESKVPV